MRLYPFPDTKATKIFLTLLMTGLLITCRDSMYATPMLLGFNKSYLATGILVALTGLAFLIYNRKHLKQILLDPRMAILAVVTGILLMPMVVKRDWQMMYISVLICLWIGICFSFFWNYQDAAKYYVLIITAMGIYSVAATYVLRILPDRGILQLPVFRISTGHLFHNFGLAVVSDEFVRLRNFGIFREPSVHHCFVLLALFLNNYTVIWKEERQLWILNALLSVIMVSTMATGGFVELAILAAVVFFQKKLYKNKKVWILICAMIFLLGIILTVSIIRKNSLYWELYGAFVWKFQKGADSSTDRVGSIIENAKFFFGNPLVGGKIAAIFDTVANNTSSSTLLFAIFGVLGGMLHVAVWVALVWNKNHSVWSNLTLLLVLFMALNTQNLIADVHFWMIPTMALCQRGPHLVNQILAKRQK